MEERIIAIGDIHGCPTQLEEVLDFCKQFPQHTLVFLGDYIDRGPKPEEVLNRLRTIDGIFLQGNHEEMFFTRLGFCKNEKAIQDLYKKAAISKSSMEWLQRSTLTNYETRDYFFVHAGLDKSKKLEEQTIRDYLWTIENGDYSNITNKLVVHGHYVVKNPVRVGNRLNINTGCGSGGTLTAVVLPEMVFFSSSQSEGLEFHWEKIRQDLSDNLEELEEI